jgi:inner membrane protein
LDTGTHLVVGIGLAGLAHIQPAIAADGTLMTAVLIGAVIGSQIPDIDTALRIKSNELYIRHHRGITHSLPFLLLWPSLITGILAILFPQVSIGTVWLWTFIGVTVHVFSDMFNTYGTQALRPITEKWISWNIIHIFDPIIFFTHLAAILMWSFQLAAPNIIFPILYGFLIVYYIWRTLHHAILHNKVKKLDPNYIFGERIWIIPTVHLYTWHIVKMQHDDSYLLGDYRNGKLRWIDAAHRDTHPAVEASKKHSSVDAFLYFTEFACSVMKEHHWGYEVRWVDIRYRHRKQYPFVAVILMDHHYNVTDSYIGWVSDSRLEKKLGMS